MVDAFNWMRGQNMIERDPVRDFVAAVSVGIVGGQPALDLDYAEDSACDTDMNVVMTGAGRFVEIQGTAEGHPFSRDEMSTLLDLASHGISRLIAAQRSALG
jgi:ribonuclease PH